MFLKERLLKRFIFLAKRKKKNPSTQSTRAGLPWQTGRREAWGEEAPQGLGRHAEPLCSLRHPQGGPPGAGWVAARQRFKSEAGRFPLLCVQAGPPRGSLLGPGPGGSWGPHGCLRRRGENSFKRKLFPLSAPFSTVLTQGPFLRVNKEQFEIFLKQCFLLW